MRSLVRMAKIGVAVGAFVVTANALRRSYRKVRQALGDY